jgi:hypothetical protein
MKEAPTYRFELEQLLDYFGGKRVLSVSEISRYVGKSRKWCRETLGVSHDTSIVSVAKKLAEMA